jgi:hypothetical protein
MTVGRIPNVEGGIQPTLLTTTGDIIYASSASNPARLGIGSSAQVLTVAAGIPSWATPSSGSMTLLSTTTLSGTVTTVSSINQTYKNLLVIVSDSTWDTSDDSPAFYTNVSNVTSMRKINASTLTTVSLTTNVGDLNDGVQNYKRTGGNNFITFLINDYSATTRYKTFQVYSSYEGDTSNGRLCFFVGGFATDTAISSVSYKISSDENQTGGTMRIYGVN